MTQVQLLIKKFSYRFLETIIKHNNKNRNKIISKAYKIELDDISDIDGSGNINILDTKEILLREKAKLDNGGKSKILSYLKGSGDFRSDECVELLKRSDIVITNPPFSLFREYVAQLVEYDKKFLIIGSKNAITYKEIFPLIAQNKLWLGHGFNAGNAFFSVPNTDVDRFAKGVYDEKTGLVKFRNCGWFTNLDHEKRHEDLISQLYKKYNSEEYPKYDNYDAINVDKVAEIPEDYDGVMGVPITFLDRYNPDQFEIVAFRKGDDGKDLVYSFRQDKTRQDKTRQDKSNHTSEYSFADLRHPAANGARAYINGQKKYARILIINKRRWYDKKYGR